MSTTAVRSPAEFEEQLQRYLYERSEEGRAVRVGEKEVSEQAAIVARFADLFSRGQLETLRSAEEETDGDEREREELGDLQAEVSATFNDMRLDLLRASEELEGDLSGEPDPVARNEEE